MNLISNLTNSYNPVASLLPNMSNDGISNLMLKRPALPSNLMSASTLPLNLSQTPMVTGGVSNGNFIQNFVSQMMNLAQTFMQNMFSLVGLSVQGGNPNQVNNGVDGLNIPFAITTPYFPDASQGESSFSLGSILKNLLGNVFGSNGSSGSFLSNIWSVAKNLLGGIFGGSKGTDGASGGSFLSNLWDGAKSIFGGLFGGSKGTDGASGGSFLSNLWDGAKSIFGGLFGGGASSASSSGIGGFLSTACNFVKDIFF